MRSTGADGQGSATMTISRRRFLSISLATACLARSDQQPPQQLRLRSREWSGHALGTTASIRVRGKAVNRLDQDITVLVDTVRQVEMAFNLFDPDSEISRLNRHGILHQPSHHFSTLALLSREIHQLTNGYFEPTVQAQWVQNSHW